MPDIITPSPLRVHFRATFIHLRFLFDYRHWAPYAHDYYGFDYDYRGLRCHLGCIALLPSCSRFLRGWRCHSAAFRRYRFSPLDTDRAFMPTPLFRSLQMPSIFRHFHYIFTLLIFIIIYYLFNTFILFLLIDAIFQPLSFSSDTLFIATFLLSDFLRHFFILHFLPIRLLHSFMIYWFIFL